ncbi:dihydrolipoyl dehydrogenase [Parachlamydia sp. AcF125]|uniref:dihydrolipoyl dehydrogenase n=1 Tax=Parachlamydia sp. AcF125 TaxID=2795736 RepID=UPI001BC9F23D|nr:dihydrolipoyl dehydrogenase [Parachlamydia sp. AcF125]MBS4168582.1 Dihydrolipoyl dehydrogenase [Parachlamydia sp. AcF125]
MTSTLSFDIVVIGSGPGGYVAAIRAAQLGFKTACIEKEPTLGGTCLNVGCIPSKALLYSSEMYHFLQKDAKTHGIEVSNLHVEFPQMMKRKQEVVSGFVQGVAGLFKKNKVERIAGTARLLSPHAIEVKKDGHVQKIQAKYIVLATGSEPIALPFLPFDEKIVLSSTGALSLPKIPKKLVVVGAGVIGVELASVYARLGSQVKVVERLDHICPMMDQAIRKALWQTLKKQGLEFYLSANVTGAEIGKEQVRVQVEQEGKNLTFEAEHVLVAVGRRPYSKGLGLQEVGIQVSPRGFVEVNQDLQTHCASVYAIGDLVEGAMLAHRASEEGIAVVEKLAGLHPQVNYMAIPNVIYTHPEVASVGLTEQEAKDAQLKVQIGSCLFKANSRARSIGDTDGMVKIIGEAKTGRLIGLHIIGPNASEMIGEGVIALEKKATLSDMAYASHPHPTLSEAIKEAALNALGHAIHF